MRLYKHKLYSELIEFIGLGHSDYVFRYLGEEFKDKFFSLSKHDLKQNYIKINWKTHEKEIRLPSVR
jgi:hypothetical protein